MTDALILGGGFGGLETAHRLRAGLSSEDRVTLIDRSETFVVGAAKLWDVVGLRSLEASSGSRSNLVSKGIDFVHAEIRSIDPATRTVETTEGTHRADFLVVALGATFDRAHIDMLRPPAFNLYDPASLPAIREALATLTSGRIVVAVMGMPYKCPPAPYEACFLIDRFLRDNGRREQVEIEVCTVQPSPLPVAGPEASARVAQTLKERDIALLTDKQGIEVDAAAGELRFSDGEARPFDVFLGVPRHVAPDVIRASGLAGGAGWIAPDTRTLETSFDGVYAIGDCVALPNAIGEIPKAGVFAEAQGRVVADRILARAQGREGATFDGHGYCFLEFAGGTAAKVEGDFFAEPRPDVALAEPDEEIFREKESFVSDRISRWL